MKKQKQNKTTNQNKTLNILCFAKPRDDDDRKNPKERSKKHYNHIFFNL